MDDYDAHLEADRLFGPCGDPTCPGTIEAFTAEQGRSRRLTLVRTEVIGDGDDEV